MDKIKHIACGVCGAEVEIKKVERWGENGVDIKMGCTKCKYKTSEIVTIKEKQVKKIKLMKVGA